EDGIRDFHVTGVQTCALPISKWKFQTVYKDVWDYDLGSQITLIDFPKNGEMVPALILPSKQGDIYILDRRTGEPLVGVEERKARSEERRVGREGGARGARDAE